MMHSYVLQFIHPGLKLYTRGTAICRKMPGARCFPRAEIPCLARAHACADSSYPSWAAAEGDGADKRKPYHRTKPCFAYL